MNEIVETYGVALNTEENSGDKKRINFYANMTARGKKLTL